MLKDLKRKLENARRQIEVYPGDFNKRVLDILTAENIGSNEATFCLLDQRTFECHWATVQRLASFKKQGYKIELFYFLAAAWMDRALAAIQTEDGRQQARLWWGGDGWEELHKVRGIDRARLVAARFVDELHYRSAEPYAIYQRTGGGRVMYYKLHATDHPDAPMPPVVLHRGDTPASAGALAVWEMRRVLRRCRGVPSLRLGGFELRGADHPSSGCRGGCCGAGRGLHPLLGLLVDGLDDLRRRLEEAGTPVQDDIQLEGARPVLRVRSIRKSAGVHRSSLKLVPA